MKYKNPVISGFFPDPSVCRVDDTFYLVCSSFHFFPGVPLFKSKDLVNWTMIGNVLTRKSQLPLDNVSDSAGIFAPTIRYNNGRFYMVTTNVSSGGNFYVYTDDINGEWSEPVFVAQGGIDPSLYFENNKVYFISNGADDENIEGITICEIDIETGAKLTPSKNIWTGTGGRFLESPHLYKINGTYYLMASEGGTEYGHTVVYAKGNSPYGPFCSYEKNPVLTNRNLGGYVIQGCGHADLVDDVDGNYWMVHLGFRQIDSWVMHHITGREVYLAPVKFDSNGWFTAGIDGTTRAEVDLPVIKNNVIQNFWKEYTFDNTSVGKEWCFLRNPMIENYQFSSECFMLRATDIKLNTYNSSPTFIAIRQKEMNLYTECDVTIASNEAGITFYMSPEQHYDISIRKNGEAFELFRRIRIGDISQEDNIIRLENQNKVSAKLIVEATNFVYKFKAVIDGTEYQLGNAQTKFLSTEIAGNFTGVMIGLYAQQCDNETCDWAEFKNFLCKNQESESLN